MSKIFRGPQGIAIGVKLAVAVLAQGKAAATTNIGHNTPSVPWAPLFTHKAAVRKFVSDQSEALAAATKDLADTAEFVWDITSDVSYSSATLRPLNYEEARLWLQAWNAGPYALLKYRGNVPYRETREYTPRVMKYYQEDLSNTPYEPYIMSAARRFGHDPQMIRAIMKTESDFRIRCVSHAGARGLMQVMPCVWSEIRKRYKLEWEYHGGVFEPEKNIEVACAYLAWLRYDFLPKHFDAFTRAEIAPPELVRDYSRHQTQPRIVVKSATRSTSKYADAYHAKLFRNAAPGLRHLKREVGARTVARVFDNVADAVREVAESTVDSTQELVRSLSSEYEKKEKRSYRSGKSSRRRGARNG